MWKYGSWLGNMIYIFVFAKGQGSGLSQICFERLLVMVYIERRDKIDSAVVEQAGYLRS
jgi:hypothetical protein